MLKGYFDTIPKDLDEAATVDGLGPFGVFWRVVLPLARPGLAVTMFYTFLTAWGEVAYASAFLNTNDKFTLAYGLQTFVPKPPTLPVWELLTPPRCSSPCPPDWSSSSRRSTSSPASPQVARRADLVGRPATARTVTLPPEPRTGAASSRVCRTGGAGQGAP